MTKKLKPLPRFKSEAAERKFWETHDSTEYVDWSKAERARPCPILSPRPRAFRCGCQPIRSIASRLRPMHVTFH